MKVLRGMISDLEFGEVQLAVHRGEFVEVGKSEKIRFAGRATGPKMIAGLRLQN